MWPFRIPIWEPDLSSVCFCLCFCFTANLFERDYKSDKTLQTFYSLPLPEEQDCLLSVHLKSPFLLFWPASYIDSVAHAENEFSIFLVNVKCGIAICKIKDIFSVKNTRKGKKITSNIAFMERRNDVNHHQSWDFDWGWVMALCLPPSLISV